MADESSTDTSATDDSTDATADEQLGEAGQRALTEERRNRRAAERQLTQVQQQLKEIQDASRSEAERALEDARREAAETASKPLQLENTRLRVAIEKQLPADLIDRLRGDTPEELAADADKLLELVKPKGSTAPFNGGPRTPAAGTSMNDLIRQQMGR
jgi:hypothetical protein